MALANTATIGLVDSARFVLDEGIDVSKILKWISPDNLIPFSTRVVFANLITALGWLITGTLFLKLRRSTLRNLKHSG